MPRAPLALLMVGVLRVGTPAAAQAARDTARLAPLVVTADRLPRALSATTASVTVLDGERLRAAGVTHLLDALRTVPGAQVVRAGSLGAQTSLFLRGGESDYVRVLIDGVPQNDPGGAIDLAALTLDNVERVEIVRGPASVLYGSDAVVGVVQLFTRAAVDRRDSPDRDERGGARSVQLSGRAGSYGAREVEGNASFRLAGAGVALGAAHRASRGVLAFNNAFRNTIVSAAGNGEVAGVTLRAALRHGANRFEYPTDGAGAVTDRNAARDERRFSAALDLRRALGARAEWQASLLALEGHGGTSDPPDGVADTAGFFSYQSVGVVRRRAVETRLVLHPATGHDATLGAEVAWEGQRLADSSNYHVSRNRFAAQRTTRAAYAQWLAEVGRLTVTAGGRYDDNDVFGAFRTGRLSAALLLWGGARARAAIGTSFKAPTFLEQFSTAFSIGNAALVPERSRGWEAGVEQGSSDGRRRLAATVFDQRFRELIQYAFRGPALPNYFNVAAASARGVELEGRLSLAGGVAVWSSATALRSRVDDAGAATGAGATFVRGERLLRRAPLTLAAGVQLQRSARASLEATVTRVSERDDRDFRTFPATAVVLPPYTRLDLGGEYRLTSVAASDGVSLTYRLENVLGASYQEVANFQAPGRVVLLGMRLAVVR